ncbi:uncharacterized protein LOC113278943 [Papaver somniferum]|uniref:uncharacterized protein LOC113278943 n=1 Tax=Papaver somniferum TaxID=3469 RepID=UPI000E702938|nr:uncharacterized protein LOC113278943 [Papaver somniferum]
MAGRRIGRRRRLNMIAVAKPIKFSLMSKINRFNRRRKPHGLKKNHGEESKKKSRVPRASEDYKDYKEEKHDNVFDPIGNFLVIADLMFEGGEVSAAVVRTIMEMDTPSSRFSEPLNGLICLFDPEKNHSVQLCNLSTRQFTPWIKSSFISNLNVKDKDKYRLRTGMCNLGFDPATKEHKVVCIWTIHHHQVCEVLTVGDGKWRITDVLPVNNFTELYGSGASIYVNGSIYYSPWKLKCSLVKDTKPKFIVAFDVGKEKFRAIRIPDFILDQIPRFQPFEIDGHPALLSIIRSNNAKIWLFDDDYNNGCRSNTWNEVTIELPFHWGHGDHGRNSQYSVHFRSVIGTDFIILYLYRCNMVADGYHYATAVSQYSYNWKKKIFTENKINGLPSSVPYLQFVSCLSTFAESLLPVL